MLTVGKPKVRKCDCSGKKHVIDEAGIGIGGVHLTTCPLDSTYNKQFATQLRKLVKAGEEAPPPYDGPDKI